MRNKALAIIIGVIAIAIGVGYALAALEILPGFTIFFKGWWTLFLIIPGLVSIFGDNSNKVFGIFITSLGVILLLQQQGIFVMPIKKLIVPILLILFGVSLIVGSIMGNFGKKNKLNPVTSTGDPAPEYSVSFGRIDPDYVGKVFEGCTLDLAFATGKLDLRDATILHDVTIYVNAAFSGVTIIMPVGCTVDVQTSTSFGSVTNKYISSADPAAPFVHVFAGVSFGGVTIK